MNTTTRNYLFGFVIFVFVLLGGVSMILEISKNDPHIIDDPKFQNLYGYVNTSKTGLETNINSMQSDLALDPNKGDKGGGWWDNLVGTGWRVYNNIGNTFHLFSFAWDAVTGISNLLDIPPWATALIGIVITLIVVFTIISAIFRWDL